jgi:hypothetical protein
MNFAAFDLDGERGKALANLAGIKHTDTPFWLCAASKYTIQHGKERTAGAFMLTPSFLPVHLR